MRRERYSLEEQVGGLIDQGRRSRRRAAAPAAPSHVAEHQRYDLTGTAEPTRARHGSEPAHRHVA